MLTLLCNRVYAGVQCLFHFSPYSMFEIVYVIFLYYEMEFYFVFLVTFLFVFASNCVRIITYAYLGDLPNRWLLILLSIFSLQLHLKKVKMAFSEMIL